MKSDLAPTLPTGVKHRHQQDVDIIAWANQEIPKHKGNLFILTFALIFVLVFLSYFTYQLLMGGLHNKTLPEQIGILFFLCHTLVNKHYWESSLHCSL